MGGAPYNHAKEGGGHSLERFLHLNMHKEHHVCLQRLIAYKVAEILDKQYKHSMELPAFEAHIQTTHNILNGKHHHDQCVMQSFLTSDMHISTSAL